MARGYDRRHRVWSVSVIKRDRVCVVCGSAKYRQAHHLDSYNYHPEKRYLVNNGICLCRNCHTAYHCDYNKSFRVKTTRDNFEEFLKVAKFYMSIGANHVIEQANNNLSLYDSIKLPKK